MKELNKKGFTLLEILIVVAVISVLATVAIAQYHGYRTRSYNTSAKSDLRTVATAQEAYYLETSSYTGSLGTLTSTSYGVGISDGVVLPILSADSNGYTMQAYHPSGNLTYTLSSPGGNITY
jgi:prepilin-type N-terminal cleavage/methylation domain-containing protein